MNIGKQCKVNREQLGLTVEEFSHSINIDSKLYEKFENGKYIFPNDIMKIIFKTLYIEKEDVFELEREYDDITKISLKVIKECEAGE